MAQRAKRGSIGAKILLPLPAELRDEARAAAQALGIAETEWWRRAGQRELRRAKAAATRAAKEAR